MKKTLTTLAVVFVTLCTSSSALAENPISPPVPIPGYTQEIEVPNLRQLYYSVIYDDLFAPVILTKPVNTLVVKGQTAQFVVEYMGNPTPTVLVFKNNKPVDFKTSLSSVLGMKYHLTCRDNLLCFTISNLSISDTGTYTFRVTNTLGTDLADFTITVLDI